MDIDGFDGGVYFRLLAAVAAADGEICASEVEKLGQLLGLTGADPSVAPGLCDEAVQMRATPLRFLEDLELPERVSRIYLRDALLVAFSDGSYSEEEVKLIHEAATLLSADSFLDDIEDWVRASRNLAARAAQLF